MYAAGRRFMATKLKRPDHGIAEGSRQAQLRSCLVADLAPHAQL